MFLLGSMCYCYNKECNEKYRIDHNLNYEATHIGQLWTPYLFKDQKKRNPIPKCPYCKKKMTVTVSMTDKDDISW